MTEGEKSDAPSLEERVDRVLKSVETGVTFRQLTTSGNDAIGRVANLGYLLFSQGKYKEGRVIFEGLTAVTPAESYFPLAVGACCLALHELDDAIKYLSKAIELAPDDVAAYTNRGEAYLRLGRLAEAAVDFKTATIKDPSGEDPFSKKARLLAKTALDRLKGQKK